MRFSPQLFEAVLIRRYKRFLADVQLADGSVITAHVANTGSMTGLDTPGLRIWLRDSQNEARKYRFSWELVAVPAEEGGQSPGDTGSKTGSGSPPCTLVSVNTGTANRIVREAVEQGMVDELRGYDALRAEVRHGHSRLDFLLSDSPVGMGDSSSPYAGQSDNPSRSGAPAPNCYLEVKSVTLAENGVALFPDAVTIRGAKHLEELGRIASAGERAVVFFCVQRGDTREMRPADAIDPEFGRALRSVIASGVEVIAWAADVSPAGVRLSHALPVKLNG